MGVYIWSNNPRLPAEYQEVEYIQNSGNLYINSGYAPNQDTKAELKFSNWTESGSNDVFGTDKNFANSGFTLLPTVPCYGNQTIDVSKNVGDGNLHTITLGKDGYVVDGELITTFNTQTFSSLNLYLFALNRNGRAREYAHYRFYYMKIWDNGTLVRDFIPCYRKSDDVIGLYDIVNSQFYTKSGSGTFTKGSDVIYFERELKNAYIGEYTGRLPSAYQEVERIGSSRTQVINTGVIPATQTYTAELEVESTQSGTEYWAFGIWGTTGFRGGQDSSGHWDTSFGASYEPSSYSLNTKTKITMSNAGRGTSSTTAIGLFGMGENGAYPNNRKGAYKIYYCKIWNSGTLIRDFVPCYRISDNVIGMYDLVNDQFYTNSGTGTFTKGNDVN